MAYGAVFVMMTLISSRPKLPATQWASLDQRYYTIFNFRINCFNFFFFTFQKIEKNIFGNSNGPIWLDQVMCFGNETSIDQCNHWNWGEHNCNHTEDVALHCSAGPPPRSQRYSQTQIKGGRSLGRETTPKTYSQIGLWERSSKAVHTPRRCGIFKDDLTDEYAHREERVVREMWHSGVVILGKLPSEPADVVVSPVIGVELW